MRTVKMNTVKTEGSCVNLDQYGNLLSQVSADQRARNLIEGALLGSIETSLILGLWGMLFAVWISVPEQTVQHASAWGISGLVGGFVAGALSGAMVGIYSHEGLSHLHRAMIARTRYWSIPAAVVGALGGHILSRIVSASGSPQFVSQALLVACPMLCAMLGATVGRIKYLQPKLRFSMAGSFGGVVAGSFTAGPLGALAGAFCGSLFGFLVGSVFTVSQKIETAIEEILCVSVALLLYSMAWWSWSTGESSIVHVAMLTVTSALSAAVFGFLFIEKEWADHDQIIAMAAWSGFGALLGTLIGIILNWPLSSIELAIMLGSLGGALMAKSIFGMSFGETKIKGRTVGAVVGTVLFIHLSRQEILVPGYQVFSLSSISLGLMQWAVAFTGMGIGCLCEALCWMWGRLMLSVQTQRDINHKGCHLVLVSSNVKGGDNDVIEIKRAASRGSIGFGKRRTRSHSTTAEASKAGEERGEN